MLDRIQQLVAEIESMGDNIAHDLKSPLTRIRGLAEVTLTTDSETDDYRQMAADTIEECDRLLQMIDTMLIIARTEAGVGRAAAQPLDLARLVREGCGLFAPLAEDRGIELDCQNLPESLFFKGDRAMLQRMLANLLDNAIKYTAAGGSVGVGLMPKGRGEVLLSVTDTGSGIDPAEQPLVFKRFYRCDRSRTLPGSGLGLSLARAVARAHGGEISVRSAPGRGSTFSVVLPL